uniref:Oxidoreductase n=1 Tax=Anisakis simplex TaxID=6269 RepID=A0A0M3JNV7_ANISI
LKTVTQLWQPTEKAETDGGSKPQMAFPQIK